LLKDTSPVFGSNIVSNISDDGFKYKKFNELN